MGIIVGCHSTKNKRKTKTNGSKQMDLDHQEKTDGSTKRALEKWSYDGRHLPASLQILIACNGSRTYDGHEPCPFQIFIYEVIVHLQIYSNKSKYKLNRNLNWNLINISQLSVILTIRSLFRVAVIALCK